MVSIVYNISYLRMQKEAAVAVSVPTSGTAGASSYVACSVFLVVGGTPGGEVRLTRGIGQGSTPGPVLSAEEDGESDNDTERVPQTSSATDQSRVPSHKKSGFGLMPFAFFDRLVECALVDGLNDSVSGSAGQRSSLRQCRIPALFVSSGSGAARSTPLPSESPGISGGAAGGSKRVMSAMQVRESVRFVVLHKVKLRRSYCHTFLIIYLYLYAA